MSGFSLLRRGMWGRTVCAVCWTCLGAGCSPNGTGGSVFTVRDSLGIGLVESNGVPSVTRWLAETPEVEIGGDPGGELFRVRGAARLTDGRIVVANGASGEIRFFSPEGRFQHSVGRTGGGPGEFAMLTGLAVAPGDTLLAFDALGGRLSVFGADGRFARAVRLTPGEGFTPTLFPVGSLVTGAFVARARVQTKGTRRPAAGRVMRSERPNEGLLLFGPEGHVHSRLGLFPGMESTLQVTGDGGGFSIRSVPVPFQKSLMAAAADTSVAVATTDHYEVRLFGPTGALRWIIREARQPRTVGAADLDAWIAHRFGHAPGTREFLERRRSYDGVRVPEILPAFDALLIDNRNRVWVREHAPPGSAEMVRWRVFDVADRELFEVAMPSALRPTHIGLDFVLGVWEDDLDIERVRLYRFRDSADSVADD